MKKKMMMITKDKIWIYSSMELELTMIKSEELKEFSITNEEKITLF